MFDRFTTRARKAVELATAEARRRDHARTGTGHLLLGVLGADAVTRVLRLFDTTTDEVRHAVEGRVSGTGTGGGATAPLTPEAEQALRLSLREAFLLDEARVDSEHLLLALMSVPGAAAEVLTAFGLTRERVRAVVARASAPSAAPAAPAPEVAAAVAALRDRYVPRDVAVTGAAFVAAARLAAAFVAGTPLPDSAATLLDDAAAVLRRGTRTRPARLDDLDDLIEDAKRDKNTAVEADDFEAAAGARARERELRGARDDLEDRWRAGELPRLALVVDEELVVAVTATRAGVPVSRVRAALAEGA